MPWKQLYKRLFPDRESGADTEPGPRAERPPLPALSGPAPQRPWPFIVFAAPRTGSYGLVSKLDSADDITCHGELFKPEQLEMNPPYPDYVDISDAAARDAAPLEFLDALKALSAPRHFGFKLFNAHIKRVDALGSLMKDPAWKCVVLYRDPIAVYASNVRARLTGVWTLKGSTTADPKDLDKRITFEADDFRQYLSYYGRYLERCARLADRPNTFLINYDEINDPAAINLLLAFLGSRHTAANAKTEYRKQFTKTLEEGFKNWEAVEAHLADEPAPTLPPSTLQTLMARGEESAVDVALNPDVETAPSSPAPPEPGPVDMTPLYQQFPALERAEEDERLRIDAFRTVMNSLPKGATGAVMGSATGAFAEGLVAACTPGKLFLVAPWNRSYGEFLAPDGDGLSSFAALGACYRRFLDRPGTEVVVEWPGQWASQQPDASLDWVFVDRMDPEEDVNAILDALASVLGPEGMILGIRQQAPGTQDAPLEPSEAALAAFCERSGFERMPIDVADAFALRRRAAPPNPLDSTGAANVD